MIQRIKQFTKGLTAKVSEEERQWVQGYLSPKEYQLFLKLRRDEQRHCIDVARHFTEKGMIRLGLLHDIGKLCYPLNLIQKSIMVIGDKLTHHKLKHLKYFKMVKGYYGHPKFGVDLLKKIGVEDAIFLERVKNHHNDKTRDKVLKQFQKIDEQS